MVEGVARGEGAAVVEPAVLRRGGSAGVSEEALALFVISTDGGQRALARAGQLVALDMPNVCVA